MATEVERAQRVLIAFDGEKWHVRRVHQVEHDLDQDEKVYRCDWPISNDHPTLADVPEVAEVIRAEILRLAEQAEREARKSTVGHLAERQKMTSAELQADWPWRSITADGWKEFAAWLRATAGEKGKGGQ